MEAAQACSATLAAETTPDTMPDGNQLGPGPVRSHEVFKRAACSIGRLAGRVGLPLAGAYAGLWLALHGAEQSVEVDGMRVEASTDVGFDEELYAEVILQDSAYSDPPLTSITFPKFLDPLPIGVDIKAYPAVSNVEAAIHGRFIYAQSLEAEARAGSEQLINTFAKKAAIGIGSGVLLGLATNEMVAAGYRRYRQNKIVLHPRPVLRGVGYSALTLAILSGSGAVVGHGFKPDMSEYQAEGLIDDALKAQNGFASINLQNEALNTIFRNFQEANACPNLEPHTEQSPSSLTVTTYNIKRGEFDISAVSSELAQTGSDVILLQEVTPEDLEVLSENLGMQAVEGWTIHKDDEVFGNAILTHLKINSFRSYWLPSEGVEARGLLTARLVSPNGEEFIVASTHLTNERMGMQGDRNEKIRIAQATAIQEILTDIPHDDEAILLGGDMNQSTSSEVYKILTHSFSDTLEGEEEIASASSFPSNGQRFDIIVTNTKWPTENARRGGGTASDHCSETVTLEMTDPYAIPVTELIQLQPIAGEAVEAE
ncbi:MAG: endonuclease [Candidatus Saccharibacteria bacterium]|nr:endonuclease [Candidatus Saccharibacteria bacterium]